MDLFSNPGAGPQISNKKPSKGINALAFIIVAILFIGALALWLGVLTALIAVVFSLSIGKAIAAAVLLNFILVSIAPNRTK
jgi:hypothetical protein